MSAEREKQYIEAVQIRPLGLFVAYNRSRPEALSQEVETLPALPDTLSYDRLKKASNEWYVAPHGAIEPENPPQTARALLNEVAVMYTGGAPFTHSRSIALEY